MRASILTVPFDPSTGRLDDTALDAFSTDKTIVGVDEQFCEHGGQPFWSLVVRWHPQPSAACHPPAPAFTPAPPSGRCGRADWRATLAAEQAGIFDALKRWRNSRAKRVAPFADRVVHHALCAAIEPALERFAIDDSYACRPGRGISRALRRLQHFTRRRAYAMRLDVARCFPSIGHARLLDRLRRRFADAGLLRLLARIVEVPQPGCAPGHGLPIGSLTSQHLANFYLGHLDRHAVQGLRVGPWLRYMDDMVCLADDKPSLWSTRDALARFAQHALGLSLKPSATRVMPVSDGVPFLGFRVFPGTIRLGPRAVRRWRRSMRDLQRAVDAGRLDEDDADRRAASLLGWADHADTPRRLPQPAGQRIRWPGMSGAWARGSNRATGSTAAAGGTTTRPTAGQRTATTTTPPTATPTRAFVWRAPGRGQTRRRHGGVARAVAGFMVPEPAPGRHDPAEDPHPGRAAHGAPGPGHFSRRLL